MPTFTLSNCEHSMIGFHNPTQIVVICIYVYMYIYIYIYIYVCVCVYIYVCMLILSSIYIQEIEILSASQNSPNNGSSLSIEVPCKEAEPKEEKVPIQSPFQYEEKKNRKFFQDFKLLDKVGTP